MKTFAILKNDDNASPIPPTEKEKKIIEKNKKLIARFGISKTQVNQVRIEVAEKGILGGILFEAVNLPVDNGILLTPQQIERLEYEI